MMTTVDRELEDLFEDQPGLAEMAHLLRSARPVPQLDPRYQAHLRSRLVLQAAGRGSRRRWPALRRRLSPLGWAGAGAAMAAMAGAALIMVGGNHPRGEPRPVTVSSALNGQPATTSDLITVAFSQPMEQQAVVAGLRIRPATAVQTAWRGTDLIITPLHHLAPNTPYTVTIDERSARSRSGGLVRGGVHIAFGTAPEPASSPGPGPAQPPQLDLSALGPVANPTRLLLGSDGTVIATRGIVPMPASGPAITRPSPSPSPSPVPGPSSTAQPSPSPSPQAPAAAAATPGASPDASPPAAAPPSPPAGTPVPMPSPTAPNALGPALVRWTADGRGHRLGPAASAAAIAPDGSGVAATVPDGHGADIVLERPDSTERETLAHSDTGDTDVIWASADRLLYVNAGLITSVDLHGAVQPVAPVPPGRSVRLAPGGSYAFEAPPAGSPAPGSLVNLATGVSRDLPGSHSAVAFSPDGRTIAWLDGRTVKLSATDHDTTVLTPITRSPAGSISDLAVSDDQTKLAYATGNGGGATTTVVARSAAGRVLAVSPGSFSPVFSPAGDRIAVAAARGATLEVATAAVPSAAPPGPPPLAIPAGAAALLDRLLTAQVAGDTTTLLRLAGGDRSVVQRTPAGLSRSNIVDSATRIDGTVVAHAELLADPSAGGPASVSEETLALTLGDDGFYHLRSASVGLLHERPSGPHILGVEAANADASTVVITFDSDLSPRTVGRSIMLRTPDGRAVPAIVSYNPDTRAATVTAGPAAGWGLQLVIGTGLTDIYGQPLASPFAMAIRG